MTTVYIAGPMTGIPEFNYPLFNLVAKHLRDRGLDVRNPAENDGGSADKSWDFYVRLGLGQLLECDSIVMLPGWENSKGARLELSVAEALGMRVTYWGAHPPCRCQHDYHEGDCPGCLCTEYRPDDHVYPVGAVVTS